MADAVTSVLLENGNRNWAYNFTNYSDGTGENDVVKVDGSASGPLGVLIGGVTFYPLTHIKITEILWTIQGFTAVRIQWDATTKTDAEILATGQYKRCYSKSGGLFIPIGLAGATGKILFLTEGAAAGASYSIEMRGTKGIHQ